jgi:DNA-binding transcriptional MerR regulator/methylmalonyl-CoA mutase cobalamin-binding subunit
MNSSPLAQIPAVETGIGISAVERDVGLGKDTLRVWERRYGFPTPLRDSFGERVYPAEQVAKLRLVKRLMDQGQRPGKLLGQSVAALNEQLGTPATAIGADAAADWVVPLLKQRELDRLRGELSQRLAREGLQRFVIETVPALNRRIGDGWMGGEIEIFEEHLYTELIQNLLRASIHGLSSRGTTPRVLLTTIKDEEHQLGLLMVEALLAANGAACVSLGAQTPVGDIAGAARATGAEIVALSFSGACPWRKARDSLIELRAALPPAVALWAGGAGLAGRARKLAGVLTIEGLGDIAVTLADWRAGRTG